jgi:hypothetical protein
LRVYTAESPTPHVCSAAIGASRPGIHAVAPLHLSLCKQAQRLVSVGTTAMHVLQAVCHPCLLVCWIEPWHHNTHLHGQLRRHRASRGIRLHGGEHVFCLPGRCNFPAATVF